MSVLGDRASAAYRLASSLNGLFGTDAKKRAARTKDVAVHREEIYQRIKRETTPGQPETGSGGGST